MIRLPKTLQAWGTADFAPTLKAEVAELPVADLPLQQGLSASNYAVDSKPELMVINVSDDDAVIRVKAGIFYAGIIAGCSCADDPTPVEEQSEYCVVQMEIDKRNAETKVSLAPE